MCPHTPSGGRGLAPGPADEVMVIETGKMDLSVQPMDNGDSPANDMATAPLSSDSYIYVREPHHKLEPQPQDAARRGGAVGEEHAELWALRSWAHVCIYPVEGSSV